jgi:hypothetical protein
MKKSILFFYSILMFSFSISSQSFQWAHREGDQTNGQALATDNTGNIYVTGRIYATTTIGGQALNIANGEDFLAKYDNAGNLLWIKQLDSLDVFDVECNNANVVVTGRYRSGASFGGTLLPGGSGWDGFIVKLDPGGNITWTMTINNTSSYEVVSSVSFDNGGNLYVTGTFGGFTATIGSTTLTGEGFESMYILKMAANGTILWSKTSSTDDGAVTGNRIDVAPSGDIYVMSTAFGDSIYYDSFYYYAGPYEAELLVHYNNSGTALDIAEINHNSQDNVTDMTVDGNGNVYTLQTNYLTSFDLAKFSPALDTIWVITDGTGGHLSVRSVNISQTGQIIVNGEVGEDATFGSTYTVYDYDGSNGFLAYYNSSGSFNTLKEIPGRIFMGAAGLDASDNVYITGTMNDSAKFDGINLTTSGVESMFLAKYGVSTGITSIQENNFLVYPNPCSFILNCNMLDSSVKNNIKLYNSLGEKIFEKEIESGFLQIDLSDQKKGIYLFNIISDKAVFTKKIIIN